jgi:hypothetical protein
MQPDDANAPAPCPFCGSGLVQSVEWDRAGWAVTCGACRIFGPLASDTDRAVAKWNDRVSRMHNLGLTED